MLGDASTWDVVFFASVDFDAHAQRPQAVARDLAARGARVLYVDNIGLRLPGLRDHRRVVRRLRASRHHRAGAGGAAAVTPVGPGSIEVVSPLLLPLDHRPPVRHQNRRWLLRRIRRWTQGSDRPLVVWTYLPNPLIADVATDLGAARLVYEYADLASVRLHARSARHRDRVARWEQSMFDRADAVFVPTARLTRTRGVDGPHVHVVPHGAPPAGTRAAAAWPEIHGLARPRLAFVGSISPVVDLDLLEAIARRRPDWSIVLAGPARVSVRDLERLPNVCVVGERPQADIATLLADCDVGLVPYRTDAAGIGTVSPLKVGDYRRAGLPVVMVDLDDDHGTDPGITIATGVDGFIRAVERSLEHGRNDAPDLRSWSTAVGEMVALVRRDGIDPGLHPS